MNKFYIISTDLMKLPLDGTHILSNRKFAKGFAQNGYEVIEILSNDEIYKIENNYGNIILLSNFMDFKNDWDKMVEFGIKYDKIFYILWCWHSIPNPPFKYWIYTFQEILMIPKGKNFKNEYNLFRMLEKQKKFINYRFGSYIDPNSNYKLLNNVEKIYDVVYIGTNYETDIWHSIKKNNKYKSFIHVLGYSNGTITGDEFEKIYRQSKICLGFMCKINCDYRTVTERIWEAFSFGCMVITNSKPANIITNQTCVHYNDKEECLNLIDYYLNNEEERQKKINEGYKIFESYGNYKVNAREFINHIQTQNLT
jgi:spore maturation protein CgeB